MDLFTFDNFLIWLALSALTGLALNIAKRLFLNQPDDRQTVTKELLKQVQTERADDWTSLPLKTFLNYTDTPNILEKYRAEEGQWTQRFLDTGALIYMHYRSRMMLLLEGHVITTVSEEDKSRAETLRRYITASAIVFDHEVPKNLWLFDDQTLHMVYCYISYTRLLNADERLAIYHDLHIGRPHDILDEAAMTWYRGLVEAIPNIFKMMSTVKGSRLPSLFILTKFIKERYPELWTFLKEDERNLAKLLTLSYASAGYRIPQDCLCIDDFIYDYLKKEQRYWKFDKPTKLEVIHTGNPAPAVEPTEPPPVKKNPFTIVK